MDWNANLGPFITRPENSFGFPYNYNYDHYPGMEMKPPTVAETPPHMVDPAMDRNKYYGNPEKKKRLTNDQLESLESSFQEEIKLDPDRKMKLAQKLGLQPRQIAVWFQNRRARWKNKQLERLYDSLKQEFDVVCREKQKLQEEVLKLKIVLREQSLKKQVSANYTDVSGEETIESPSVPICSSNKSRGTSHGQIAAECNYLFNVEDYNPLSPPYWGFQPSYP